MTTDLPVQVAKETQLITTDLPVQVLKVDSEHEPLALADGRVPPPEEVSVVLVGPELEDVAEVKVRVVRPVLVAAIFFPFAETVLIKSRKTRVSQTLCL